MLAEDLFRLGNATSPKLDNVRTKVYLSKVNSPTIIYYVQSST